MSADGGTTAKASAIAGVIGSQQLRMAHTTAERTNAISHSNRSYAFERRAPVTPPRRGRATPLRAHANTNASKPVFVDVSRQTGTDRRARGDVSVAATTPTAMPSTPQPERQKLAKAKRRQQRPSASCVGNARALPRSYRGAERRNKCTRTRPVTRGCSSGLVPGLESGLGLACMQFRTAIVSPKRCERSAHPESVHLEHQQAGLGVSRLDIFCRDSQKPFHIL